jgi:ABC-2 type transport system ATP-binding protein
MLLISKLKKTYPNGAKALKDINLKIGKGMFGLLGPNGAGKSTLMRTIATLQEPDSGSIFFEGIDALQEKEQIRNILGYLPQEFGVYQSVSAEKMLHHLAILKGIVDLKKRREAVEYLLDVTNLSEHRKKSLGSFSGGMRQRFGIAQSLLGNPKMIIVDEPTAGLDPVERDRFYNLLSSVGESKLVILSTHIVSDVSELCNDMAIIQDGEVLVQASPQEAIERLKGKIWRMIASKLEIEALTQKFKLISSRLLHGKGMLRIYSDSHPGSGFELVEPDLEDVYFSFIKKIIGVQCDGLFSSLV